MRFSSPFAGGRLRRMAMMATSTLVVAAWWSAAATLPIVAGEVVSLDAALEAISVDRLRQHVDTLADDTFEGREAGSRGGRAAGVYLGQEFQRLGLAGAGTSKSYYQAFGADYRNILAVLEGSDPDLKSEYVIAGAHYDHVGYGSSSNSYGPVGRIHNGADDNASGTSALLEAAAALAGLPTPPRRSILFALWDGEEKGLLGSAHWLSQPTVPLAKVRFKVNCDMVGRLRNNQLEVFGSRTMPGLRRLVSIENRQLQLSLSFDWDMKENSDHYSFFTRGIPTLMLHTGLHSDYHRPSDDAHKVNSDGMLPVTRLLARVVYQLANEPDLPAFRSASRQESSTTRRHLERVLPPLTSRLGISWDPDDRTAPGLRVTRVVPRSPAERGGLVAGDRVVHFGGHDVDDELDFRTIVWAAASPVTAVVRRSGREEPLTLSLALNGEPVRIGIAWQQDSAEPGSVLLTRVVSGSPAERAGLEPLDRVYQVNGEDFHGSREFQALINQAVGPLELLVERRGQLREAVVRPITAAPAAELSQ